MTSSIPARLRLAASAAALSLVAGLSLLLAATVFSLLGFINALYAKTLDDIANGLNADPKAKSVLEKNQITARDYIMTMIALNRAGAAVQANAKSPADAGTNAANMAYVKANKGRIGAAMTAGRDAKADAAKAEAAKANAAKSDAAKPEAAKPDAAAK